MLFTTLVGLYCQGLKIQECGMQWVLATKELESFRKHKSVTKELNHLKTDKESQFIRWLSYIIQWDLSLN